MIKGCIFDLDGVIVDTAKYHFLAWQRLAIELGGNLTEQQNEKLKGVSRMKSLDLILEWNGIELSEEEKVKWATIKNEWYREFILKMGADEILEGVLPFLEVLKDKGIKIALGSASKNAATVIQRVGLNDDFQIIVDGTKTTRSKPDPQVFEMAAEQMGLSPVECVVFEDAPKGVDAALNGGFYAVGIGKPEHLGHAHMVIPNFINQTLESLESGILAAQKSTDSIK